MSEKLTRRAVLKLGGAAGVSALGGSSVLAHVAQAAGPRIWSRATYVPLVGQWFTVVGYPRSLRLVRIEDLPQRPAGSDDAFALIFRTAAGAPPLPDGLPTLHHPALGRFAMFLSIGHSSHPGTPWVAVVDRTHG